MHFRFATTSRCEWNPYMSHRIVRFLDRTIGPRCYRSGMFATISSSGRTLRSISTRGRAITNDWRISMARNIVGNRATSGSDQRSMYAWRPVIKKVSLCYTFATLRDDPKVCFLFPCDKRDTFVRHQCLFSGVSHFHTQS